MEAREGDLLQNKNRLIFDVKGMVHPPNRVVAFPRFIPDLNGNRKLQDLSYTKIYSISHRYRFLEEQLPHYLIFDRVFGETLCEIPEEDIRRHYSPINRLKELRQSNSLDKLEARALQFFKLLQHHSDIPWNKLGISGSLLVNLHTLKSDIDPVVYGIANCFKIHNTLNSLMQSSGYSVKAYKPEELKILHNFRSKDTRIPFNDFIKTEQRKVLQGKFLGYDYFIRCVKDRTEVKERYGDIVYRKVGYAKIKGIVSEASEAIFTPCRYSVTNVQVLEGDNGEAITEIASFRGRFCEQANKGEKIVAQGKVEKLQDKTGCTKFRLLLGSMPTDFMILER